MSGAKNVGVGAAVLALAAGAGIYFYQFESSSPMPVAIPPSAPVPAPAAPAPAEPLPKLEESDGFVRAKAAALSSDSIFASWLKTDDLLARFAAAVNMIGRGRVPKDGLSFLAPAKKYKATKKGGRYFADPRGYARYDAAARAVASIDAAAAVGIFRACKPLFQAAYDQLGERGGDVQDAFVRAARELLSVPLVPDPVALKEKGLGYAYVDDSLERLSPAQKQLLRMGPKNQAAIQAKLGELLRLLGGT